MTVGQWILNGFDMAVLIIIGVSMLTAASRGLFREMITIISLLISGIGALYLFGRLRPQIMDFIQPSWLADTLLGICAFIILYMAVQYMLNTYAKNLQNPLLHFSNRILGAGFGLLRGLIIAALLVMPMTAQHRASLTNPDWNQQPVPLPRIFEDSTFYPLLNTIGEHIRRLPYAQTRELADKLKNGESDTTFP